jgi:hypothetical protein
MLIPTSAPASKPTRARRPQTQGSVALSVTRFGQYTPTLSCLPLRVGCETDRASFLATKAPTAALVHVPSFSAPVMLLINMARGKRDHLGVHSLVRADLEAADCQERNGRFGYRNQNLFVSLPRPHHERGRNLLERHQKTKSSRTSLNWRWRGPSCRLAQPAGLRRSGRLRLDEGA